MVLIYNITERARKAEAMASTAEEKKNERLILIHAKVSAQSMGFQGAMYTAAGIPGSTNSLVGFGPAAYSPTLRR
jgi:hypothetical protein